MAVVTHGSFDEGPIILALPPSYLYDTVEIDPIFDAWDRSDGITISASQVTDFDTEVANNPAVVLNTAKRTYPSVDEAKLAAIPPGNLLVPYTGATGSVDLGIHDISVGKITINDTPSATSDGATKGYVDGLVTSGIVWTTSVKDIVATLPGSPADGDRYIVINGIEPGDNHIEEWDAGGSAWISTHPADNTTLFVEGDVNAPVNNVGLHTFNGLDWIYIGSSINHNDTLNKEGGSGGHWYHVSEAASAVIPNITTSGADIVPTGLSLSDSGISVGRDGLAWVELTWDAITISDTFDHYQIEYKKSSYTYYTPLVSTSNIILIEGLTPNTSYNFRVASVNKYGTSSAFCTDLILVTSADLVAPATVSGVSATAAIQAILLRWTHNTDVDLESYNIYRYTSDSSASATVVANFKGNVYMDNGLAANTQYYYWLKAKDTSGNLSAAFSTECHATTRNVLATDIENIAAGQVIIQGLTTLSNWISPATTTIDGAKITTGTVTLSQLNFTPITGSNVVASINASLEGIQIDADNFSVSGATVFTAKVGGSFTSANSVPRIRIFPNTDIGIEVIDDLGNNVFTAEVGGTNLGDVTIGNWAGGQGIKYDKSANSTSFAGTILASAGTIGGWIINSSSLTSTTSGMSPVDYPFYAGETYASRAVAPFRVSNTGIITANNIRIQGVGYGNIIATDPSTGQFINSGLYNTPGYGVSANFPFILCSRTTAQRDALTPSNGMMIYNTTTGQFNVYVQSAWKRIDVS